MYNRFSNFVAATAGDYNKHTGEKISSVTLGGYFKEQFHYQPEKVTLET